MATETQRPKKRQKRGLATENKVLSAAERLLREEGFDAAQVDKIVKESGVSVGSFYHHFGSKEGVIGRLVDRFCEEGRADVDALMLDGLELDAALKQVLGAVLVRFRKNPELYRTMAARMEKEPDIWQPMRELRFYYEDRLFAAIGDQLAARGIANPRHAIARMMQAVLALLTHIVIFDSGPVKLTSAEIETEIFDLARVMLRLDLSLETSNERA